MLRALLGSERIQMIDPHTGIRVIQLTSFPAPSAHFLYDWPSITPDNRRVVFFCQRYAGRGAPWDLFRCDTDGLNQFQLTERGDHDEAGGYYGRPNSMLSLNGTTVYVVWGTSLCAVDVETGRTEELRSLEDVCPQGSVFGRIHISASGKRIFVSRYGDAVGTVRVDLASGAVEEIDLGGHLFACCRTEARLVVQRGQVAWDTAETKNGVRRIINAGTQLGLWNTDEVGQDARFFCPMMFAHATLLGRLSTIQGCGLPPHRCIWTVEDGKEPQKLVEGPYFWHSGASFDGEWIVSDTNWPDMGLQLVHVPTRRFATLCHAGATQDHVEFGHPHPALSQDGRIAVFRSDRTHVSQVYLAHITDEFRERVKSGNLAGNDKWI
ncbi:MAG: PD40 domain-containing protein [Candidatus Hydrogenedentes bacterium]|nr:PD40 domain-containing protein [Candidatus Hydrogenedentota bacterium]